MQFAEGFSCNSLLSHPVSAPSCTHGRSQGSRHAGGASSRGCRRRCTRRNSSRSSRRSMTCAHADRTAARPHPSQLGRSRARRALERRRGRGAWVGAVAAALTRRSRTRTRSGLREGAATRRAGSWRKRAIASSPFTRASSSAPRIPSSRCRRVARDFSPLSHGISCGSRRGPSGHATHFPPETWWSAGHVLQIESPSAILAPAALMLPVGHATH